MDPQGHETLTQRKTNTARGSHSSFTNNGSCKEASAVKPKREPSLTNPKLLSVADMKEAEMIVIRYVQRQAFPEEVKTLQKSQGDCICNKKTSHISKLNPFMKDGILRVGGRLAKADIPEEAKFPVIIPKQSHISKLILRDIHDATGHGGRNHMLSLLHEKYWIINANAEARKIINSCVTCRKRNAKVQQQMMSDLPKDRVTPEEPPFTRVGVDYFGPFEGA